MPHGPTSQLLQASNGLGYLQPDRCRSHVPSDDDVGTSVDGRVPSDGNEGRITAAIGFVSGGNITNSPYRQRWHCTSLFIIQL